MTNSLPKPHSAQVERINELSASAKTSWFALLGYFAFVGISLLGVEDADFFLASRQTELPLIDLAIPTGQFFLFGPLLGTILYVYLHLYLLKLWEALAEAPARLDDQPLSQKVAPWLINDLGLWLRFDGAFRRRPMDWFANLFTFLLAFVSGPAIVGAFWIRYWPAHELGVSLIVASLFALTLMTMLSSLFVALDRLSRKGSYRGGWWHLIALVPSVLILAIVLPLAVAKTDGLERLGLAPPRSDENVRADVFEPWWGGLFDLRIAQADLTNAKLYDATGTWIAPETHGRDLAQAACDRAGIPRQACGADNDNSLDPRTAVTRRNLEAFCADSGLDAVGCLEFADALRFDLLKIWRTAREQLVEGTPELDFKGIDLRRANLAGAVLRNVNLEGANLAGANFSNARLANVNFFGADLSHAVFDAATVSNSDFGEVTLEGTSFEDAKLSASSFVSPSSRAPVSFRNASLTGVYFFFSDLPGVDFRGADVNASLFLLGSMPGARFDLARIGLSLALQVQMPASTWDRARLRKVAFADVNIADSDLTASHFVDSIDIEWSEARDANARTGTRFYPTIEIPVDDAPIDEGELGGPVIIVEEPQLVEITGLPSCWPEVPFEIKTILWALSTYMANDPDTYEPTVDVLRCQTTASGPAKRPAATAP